MSKKPKFDEWCDQVRSCDFNSDLDVVRIIDPEEFCEYDFDLLSKEHGRGRGVSIENHNRAIGNSKIRAIMRQMGYDGYQFLDDVPHEPDNPSNFEEAYQQEIAEANYKHFESGINIDSNDCSFGLYNNVLETFDYRSDFRKLVDESEIHITERRNNDVQSGIFACETDQTYNEAVGDPSDFRKGMEELSKPKYKNRRSVKTKRIHNNNGCHYEEEFKLLKQPKRKKIVANGRDMKPNKEKTLLLEHKSTESECNFEEAIKYVNNIGYKNNSSVIDNTEYDQEVSLEIKSNFKEAADELEDYYKNSQKASDQESFNSNCLTKAGDPSNFAEALKEILKTYRTIQDENSSPEREPYYEYDLDYVNKEFREKLRNLDLALTNEIGYSETLTLMTPATDDNNATAISSIPSTNFEVDNNNFSNTVTSTSTESNILNTFIDDEENYYGINSKRPVSKSGRSNIDISNSSTSSTNDKRYTYVPSYISESEEEFCPKIEDFPDLRTSGKRRNKSDQGMDNAGHDTSNQSSTRNIKTKQQKTRKFVKLTDFFKSEDSKTQSDNYIENDDYSKPRYNAFDITLEDLNSSNYQCTMNTYDIDQQTPLGGQTSTSVRRGGGMRRGTTRR